MPTPTYIPLATKTLTGSAASVTFTSISQSYRDLILVIQNVTNVGTQTNQGASFRLNNDSSNYSEVFMLGNGTSATSGTIAGTFLNLYSAGLTGGNTIVQFLDYSATDKHKISLVRSNLVTGSTSSAAQRWASTAAITSITLYASDTFAGTPDSWGAGGTFTLYGIEA